MQLFIINLKKSTKKKELITAELQKFEKWSGIKINYQFFEAINGNELENEDFNIYSKWFDPWSHLHLTKGEIGCALSHCALWKKLIDDCDTEQNKEKCMIILEDDFIIENKEVFKDILNIKNPTYEFLYLGRKKISKEEEIQSDLLIKSSITEHKVVQSRFSYWAIGYLLNYDCAKKLYYGLNDPKSNLSWFKQNLYPVDEYIPWIYNQTSIYGLQPFKSQNNKHFLALDPPIIRPTNNTFQNSSTYFSPAIKQYRDDIVLISVATDFNDPVKRYIQSSNKYGMNPVILGLDRDWNGGNMVEGIGGGQKVNLLREFLNTLESNKLIIFTDSYDVVANNHINIMVDLYQKYYGNNIVFGAEMSCWPDRELEKFYPSVDYKNKYLNSGNFIGWREDILKILDLPIKDNEDDQLYFTNYFLNSLKKNENKLPTIQLDYENHLFVCLNQTRNISIDNSKSCLIMSNNYARPTFIHGNGPPQVKRYLNNISNYLVGGWNSTYGYKSLEPVPIELPNIIILFDITIGENINTYKSLLKQNYPRDKIKIVKIEEKYLQKILDSKIEENVDYILYINSNIILENPMCLLNLVRENKSVIAPLCKKKNDLFSNFWGAINNNNFYARSNDYLDLVNSNKKGCWNVPYIGHCFLIKREIFNSDLINQNIDKGDGIDMAICYNLRLKNIFMWMLNNEHYGYFVDYVENIEKKNEEEEIKKYVESILRDDFKKQPDVKEIGENILKISMFKEEFCKEVIEKCNNFGDWSKGGEQYFDKRIGNVEPFPTQDIHLFQIKLQKVWEYIVQNYISKIIWNTFHYSTKNINISFVVKYDLDKQRDLKPHHDSSTYTVNLCLNNDFEGGGCRFIKQDQTVINKDIGSIIIHPGKLTHYHEGLAISKGKRFILVSFIN